MILKARVRVAAVAMTSTYRCGEDSDGDGQEMPYLMYTVSILFISSHSGQVERCT